MDIMCDRLCAHCEMHLLRSLWQHGRGACLEKWTWGLRQRGHRVSSLFQILVLKKSIYSFDLALVFMFSWHEFIMALECQA